MFIALWIPFGAFIGLEDEVDFQGWLFEVLSHGSLGMLGGYAGAAFAITVLKAPNDDW